MRATWRWCEGAAAGDARRHLQRDHAALIHLHRVHVEHLVLAYLVPPARHPHEHARQPRAPAEFEGELAELMLHHEAPEAAAVVALPNRRGAAEAARAEAAQLRLRHAQPLRNTAQILERRRDDLKKQRGEEEARRLAMRVSCVTLRARACVCAWCG